MNGVMTKLTKVEYVLPPIHEFVDLHIGLIKKLYPEIDDAKARFGAMQEYKRLQTAEVYANDQYQVGIDRRPEHGFGIDMEIWHLSIGRIDGEAARDWGDLQAIKNELVHPDVEAIELYPSQARALDTTNQFHLWCFVWQSKKGKRERPRLLLGFGKGLILKTPGDQLATQRPVDTAAK